MRKIIVLEHISLDGVIQAPGGKDEDPSGGFAHGGWIGLFSDEVLGEFLKTQMDMPFDLLLGRLTFEIWEPYWPQHPEIWPNVNKATKYVVSNTRTSSKWQPSVFLSGNIVEKIVQIKQGEGPDLHVWGSGQLVQTLIRFHLVDEFRLMIYPLTLGAGKRLFAEGTVPMTFQVRASRLTPSGVLLVHYARGDPLVKE